MNSIKQLEHLIVSRKIVVKDEPKKKSEVWSAFSALYYAESNDYVGYVKCKKSEKIFKHHMSNSGTSHLLKHANSCHKDAGGAFSTSQSSITAFYKKKTPAPRTAKEKLHLACVEFVCRDLRPLKSVEGAGMVNLVQAAIDVGAQHGKLDAKCVLPSRNTLKRKLVESAAECKISLSDSIKAAIKSNGIVGMTLDLWTDIKLRHFLCITAHFVENS